MNLRQKLIEKASLGLDLSSEEINTLLVETDCQFTIPNEEKLRKFFLKYKSNAEQSSAERRDASEKMLEAIVGYSGLDPSIISAIWVAGVREGLLRASDAVVERILGD